MKHFATVSRTSVPALSVSRHALRCTCVGGGGGFAGSRPRPRLRLSTVTCSFVTRTACVAPPPRTPGPASSPALRWPRALLPASQGPLGCLQGRVPTAFGASWSQGLLCCALRDELLWASESPPAELAPCSSGLRDYPPELPAHLIRHPRVAGRGRARGRWCQRGWPMACSRVCPCPPAP